MFRGALGGPFQIPLAFCRRKLLDRVSQHGPRHRSIAPAQEPALCGGITIADLTQHPADGFVNQVVFVIKQQISDGEGVIELSSPDERERGYHRDAPLPQRPRFGQPPQRRTAAAVQPSSHDLGGGRVDEVPVVDEARVRKIEGVDAALLRLVRSLEPVDEQHQREQSLLVNAGSEQRLDIAQTRAAALTAYRTKCRHANTDETIPFAVFARPCLEEPLQNLGVGGFRVLPKPAANLGRGCRDARAGDRDAPHRSYDSRLAEADCLIRYFNGSVQNRPRNSARLRAPP